MITQLLISIYYFHYTNQYSGRILGDNVTILISYLANHIMIQFIP